MLKKIPRNSENTEARLTAAKKGLRMRTACQRPEKALVGGAKRMDRDAGRDLVARSWYGLIIATPALD